jgi:undecaprenyl-phosphate galactose phosphotransferase/putative colanic acid biosynthesis UDP-glucose lipid carrier transferase
VGAFLRRTSIDEMPQFFNVLCNQMSVVGPRPHMLKHTEEYRKLVDKFMVRHFAKPGLTGWAQIMGYRGQTKTVKDMENRAYADIWYIENWSFLLDLKIIVKTITMVFFQKEENAF